MTNSRLIDKILDYALEDTVELVRVKRALDSMTEHATQYKALFHSMQEELISTKDELAVRGRTIAQQRAIIAKLESALGIDQEL